MIKRKRQSFSTPKALGEWLIKFGDKVIIEHIATEKWFTGGLSELDESRTYQIEFIEEVKEEKK